MRGYRLGFDIWALGLFLALLLPNFFWSAVPAPCDVLRGESATQALDSFASLCQVLSVGLMCLPLYKGQREKRAFGPWAKAALGCLCLYYLGWALYYRGLAAFWVILLLTLPPCPAVLYPAPEKLARRPARCPFHGVPYRVRGSEFPASARACLKN